MNLTFFYVTVVSDPEVVSRPALGSVFPVLACVFHATDIRRTSHQPVDLDAQEREVYERAR